MSDARIRLSDAEREAAGRALGEHYAQGRLTAEEHAERLDRIWAARMRGELAPVFADLPSRPAPTAAGAATRRRPGSAWWRIAPGPLLAVLVLLAGLTVVTHLPLFLLAIGVLWLMTARHRGWHRRHHWRY